MIYLLILCSSFLFMMSPDLSIANEAVTVRIMEDRRMRATRDLFDDLYFKKASCQEVFEELRSRFQPGELSSSVRGSRFLFKKAAKDRSHSIEFVFQSANTKKADCDFHSLNLSTGLYIKTARQCIDLFLTSEKTTYDSAAIASLKTYCALALRYSSEAKTLLQRALLSRSDKSFRDTPEFQHVYLTPDNAGEVMLSSGRLCHLPSMGTDPSGEKCTLTADKLNFKAAAQEIIRTESESMKHKKTADKIAGEDHYPYDPGFQHSLPTIVNANHFRQYYETSIDHTVGFQPGGSLAPPTSSDTKSGNPAAR